MTPDHSGGESRGDGGRRLEDLLRADEGPMRRELLRQISELELRINRFRELNAPYERLPPTEVTGPAVLSTEELEQVRDQLLGALNQLHEGVARRLTDRFPAEALPEAPDAPPAATDAPPGGPAPGRLGRWRRRLRRRPPRSS